METGRSGIGSRAALAALLAALALAPAACGGGSDDRDELAASSPEPGAPAIADLHGCGDLPVPSGFKCGSVEVPWFRKDPAKGETKIGFAVRPRGDRDEPSQGAIFAVEGGPGYSSTGTANAYTKLFGGLLDHRELVLVDMRGTGRSRPVGCPDLQRGRAPEWIALSECARRLGERFEAYNTGAAAEDIDAVRAALGLDRIALYGDSYGTYLAQAYAFRHPDRLEALVLDSAYPVRGESPWYPSLLRLGIQALSIACDRDPGCGGDPGRRLVRLTRLLRDSGRGVGPLIDALIDASGGPPGSYRRIDGAGKRLLHGHPRAYRELIHTEKVASKHPRQYSAAAELIVDCNDYPMIWDRRSTEPERRAQLEQAIREHDRETFAPFTPREVALSSEIGYLYCLTWPQPTELREPPVPRGAEPTEAPVLVVSGELDDITTPYEGRLVAEQFPNATRYVNRNAGHVDALYYKDGRSATRIRRFLRDELSGGG